MKKRGQIAIFLVVGIIILVLTAVIVYFISIEKTDQIGLEKDKITFTWQKSSFINYVEDCLEETAVPAIYLLAANGGMIYPEDENVYLLTDNGFINYAYLNGINYLSFSKMEEDLADYIEIYLPICFAGFPQYHKQNIIIEPDYEKIEVNNKILPQHIKVELDLPFKITLPDGDVSEMNIFQKEIKTNLGDIVNLAGEVAVDFSQGKDVDMFGLNYHPTIMPYDEFVTVYSLSDQEVFADDPSVIFFFAVANNPKTVPSLNYIPDVSLRVGDLWEYTLTAKDVDKQKLVFESDSNLFPVSENGEINLLAPQKGSYEVVFSVIDTDGNKDEQEVTITILEKRSTPKTEYEFENKYEDPEFD